MKISGSEQDDEMTPTWVESRGRECLDGPAVGGWRASGSEESVRERVGTEEERGRR